MDDLVSRQAAIDALEETKRSDPFNRYDYQNIGIDWSIDTIKALPSAQPYTEEELQKIQELEQAELDKAFELGKQAAQEDLQPTCNQLATDCISRQDVLNWLNDEWDGMVLSVFDGIRNLPSAQPEPQWISCKDRLPEVNESVLVTTEWNDISIAWRIGIDEWFIHEGSTNATTDDLAAWMPLPEPWKGEQE